MNKIPNNKIHNHKKFLIVNKRHVVFFKYISSHDSFTLKMMSLASECMDIVGDRSAKRFIVERILSWWSRARSSRPWLMVRSTPVTVCIRTRRASASYPIRDWMKAQRLGWLPNNAFSERLYRSRQLLVLQRASDTSAGPIMASNWLNRSWAM